MRLCTICISCIGCPPFPKKARLPAEPPSNRLQISAQTTVLPTMIRADGQVENKVKPRPRHFNRFSLSAKDGAAFSSGRHQSTTQRPSRLCTVPCPDFFQIAHDPIRNRLQAFADFSHPLGGNFQRDYHPFVDSGRTQRSQVPTPWSRRFASPKSADLGTWGRNRTVHWYQID